MWPGVCASLLQGRGKKSGGPVSALWGGDVSGRFWPSPAGQIRIGSPMTAGAWSCPGRSSHAGVVCVVYVQYLVCMCACVRMDACAHRLLLLLVTNAHALSVRLRALDES